MEADGWLEERLAWMEGYRCVAGIDEAGRGTLAGPVVAAAVVLPCERAPRGVDDSKTLTPAHRERLFGEIQAAARGIGIGIVDSATIDRINILRATHQAMRLALESLPPGLWPDLALIDGNPVRPFPVSQVALVGGDARSVSIAAASILAKVTRDRLMLELDAQYPGYGFAVHKGYCVPAHLRALESLGPCAVHRHSFNPVARCREELKTLPGTEPGSGSSSLADESAPAEADAESGRPARRKKAARPAES